MKGYRVEKLYEGQKYDPGFPPDKALGFLAWLNEQIERVPLELRESIRIDFGTREDYDTHYASIEMWYLRRETQADIAADRKILDQQAKRQREADLALLNRLKAKYEPNKES